MLTTEKPSRHKKLFKKPFAVNAICLAIFLSLQIFTQFHCSAELVRCEFVTFELYDILLEFLIYVVFQ